MDAARKRCVVLQAGNLVRVLDLETERTVHDFSTASPTTECRGLALSPSGKKLALYRPSRGVVYGHEDAISDTSSVVEVYDVDSGKRLASHDFKMKLGQVGFTPRKTGWCSPGTTRRDQSRMASKKSTSAGASKTRFVMTASPPRTRGSGAFAARAAGWRLVETCCTCWTARRRGAAAGGVARTEGLQR